MEHFGWQLTTSGSDRTVVPSPYGSLMKVLDSIWEISGQINRRYDHGKLLEAVGGMRALCPAQRSTINNIGLWTIYQDSELITALNSNWEIPVTSNNADIGGTGNLQA